MTRTQKILFKYSNIKALLFFLTLQLIFMLIIFPKYEIEINKIANSKVKILDVRTNYNLHEVKSLFNDMGNRGRSVYYSLITKVDMIYPIIYTLLLILLTAFIIKKTFPGKNKLIYLSLLPLGGIIFDYLENINTLELLRTFPNISSHKVNYGSLITQVKWTFIGISILFIIILIIIFFLKKINLPLKKIESARNSSKRKYN